MQTTVYMKLKPRWRRNHYMNEDELAGFDVDGVNKSRPRRAAGPVVKLTLSIPDQAFYPLRPEVTIDIPEEALDYTATVRVELPDADEAPA